ncbi:hypothetical protein KQX54_019442 [Cotesia glomerata]|uniref:Uncharacterized protein n=1 Tax=Cotesia glomerata TaxID=32391 RepID=A0AAV7IB53_COTGL|nr:hypothetical protein KQX54_019442 [Cotesia glomerata]
MRRGSYPEELSSRTAGQGCTSSSDVVNFASLCSVVCSEGRTKDARTKDDKIIQGQGPAIQQFTGEGTRGPASNQRSEDSRIQEEDEEIHGPEEPTNSIKD